MSAVNVLRVVWLFVIAWYELGVFYWSVAKCRWPDQEFIYSDQARKTESIRLPAHVLLVADPQVVDLNSYPDREWLLGLLSQVIIDLNMRKNWSAIRRLLLGKNNGSDEAVVFLGDMMDNGRNAYSDEEYQVYYSRFKSIFLTDSSTKTYYIPGNHDVGLGSSRTFSHHAKSRYIKHFGPLNFQVSLANHTLVMLDAPGLVEEDYRRSSSGQKFENWKPLHSGAIEFVNKFASVGTEDPVVLFSHIPLFRPDTTPCGPLRERGTIRRGVGFGYQNTLGRQTSEYILKNIQPNIIFSGDDHDYCEYMHSISLLSEGPEPNIERVREVTVKSFSMAMGIHNPGFQLLSLAEPSSVVSGTPSYADSPCFLPDQIAIYVNIYLPLLLLSLCVVAISTLRKFTEGKNHGRTYNLDTDPNDVSLIQSSPEADYTGVLGSARVPNSAGLGNGGLAPTYRASSATFTVTPGTPEFSTTSNGRMATPTLLVAPPAGFVMTPDDAEQGYLPHVDDEDDESYQTNQLHDGALFAPFSFSRSHRPRRRLAWSWTFGLRNRRRRVTLGVPIFLERAILGISRLCRRRDANGRIPKARGLDKTGRHAKRRLSALTVFTDDVWRTAWPVVLLFIIINVYISS
ncbi:hypothetical protein ACEPAG_7804 [Sanghuangporus baumii]